MTMPASPAPLRPQRRDDAAASGAGRAGGRGDGACRLPRIAGLDGCRYRPSRAGGRRSEQPALGQPRRQRDRHAAQTLAGSRCRPRARCGAAGRGIGGPLIADGSEREDGAGILPRLRWRTRWRRRRSASPASGAALKRSASRGASGGAGRVDLLDHIIDPERLECGDLVNFGGCNPGRRNHRTLRRGWRSGHAGLHFRGRRRNRRTAPRYNACLRPEIMGAMQMAAGDEGDVVATNEIEQMGARPRGTLDQPLSPSSGLSTKEPGEDRAGTSRAGVLGFGNLAVEPGGAGALLRFVAAEQHGVEADQPPAFEVTDPEILAEMVAPTRQPPSLTGWCG